METINAPSFGKSKKTTKVTIESVLKPLDNKVRKILIDLYKKNPETQIQSFIKVPKQWVSLNDFTKLERYLKNNKTVNHRTIQKDEVVIDVDSENKYYGKIHLAALEQIWDRLGYRRNQWDSGGDGYHCHFQFKQLNTYANEDVAEIKNKIIEYLCGHLMYMYKNIKTGQFLFYIKKKKASTLQKENLELCSHICLVKKKLIQIEWAPHRKGGVKKPYISDIGFVNNANIEGKTPIIPRYIKDIIEENKRIRKAEYELRKWNTEQISKAEYPPCIRFYLGETIDGKTFVDERDGTKRAMFHLISFFSHTKTEEELLVFIQDWLNKISLGQGAVDSHGKVLSSWLIRSAIKSNKGLVGCRARMELLEELNCDSICQNCPFKHN